MAEFDPSNDKLFEEIAAHLRQTRKLISSEPELQVLTESADIPNTSIEAPRRPSSLLNRQGVLKMILMLGTVAGVATVGIGMGGVLLNPEPISSRFYVIAQAGLAEGVLFGAWLYSVVNREKYESKFNLKDT